MMSKGAVAERRLTEREAFARRLRDALLRRGMSQADLARSAGVSKDAISTYMHHRSLPSDTSLAKLARALRVDPEVLLPAGGERGATPIWLQRSVSAAFAASSRAREMGSARRLTPRSAPARESAR
jgi:transcriptional regulator with XRE-family HTH domain